MDLGNQGFQQAQRKNYLAEPDCRKRKCAECDAVYKGHARAPINKTTTRLQAAQSPKFKSLEHYNLAHIQNRMNFGFHYRELVSIPVLITDVNRYQRQD
jgi:hypothetical protein